MRVAVLTVSDRVSRGEAEDGSGDTLEQLLPEISAMKGVAQPPEFHPEGDVWTHTCLMLDDLPAPRDPDLALAVLLHDVGKPVTYKIGRAHV